MMYQTVLTTSQDREARGVPLIFGSNWNGKGTHIWRLKQDKPELFEHQEQSKDERPSGFESCHIEGWLFNKERNIYFEKSTRKRYWWDEGAQQHKLLYQGETLPLAFAGGAATQATPSSSSRSTPAKAAPQPAKTAGKEGTQAAPVPPKHIIIADLHLAAKALKMDFTHLDRPAGAVAIVGSGGGLGAPSATVAAPADTAARLLPEKLLRRLYTHRGELSDEMLGAMIAGAFVDVAAALGGLLPVAATAVVVGPRIAVAATPGTHFFFAIHHLNQTPTCPTRRAGGAAAKGAASPTSTGPVMELLEETACAPALGEPTAICCQTLGDISQEALVLCVGLGDVAKPVLRADQDLALGAASALGAGTLHLSQGRARAGSMAMVRAAKVAGAEGPLAVACARVGARLYEADGAPEGAGALGSASSMGPPSKKQKVEEQPGTSKVRLRQLLLRHSSLAKPVDPVRNKPVHRSMEEAEEQMLSLADSLASDSCASFASVCKAISECPSALKGLDLAGDLGWLDRRIFEQKAKEKDKPVKLPLPSNVLRSAFELGVGELSDIFSSDQGIHLIQRTA